MAKLSIVSTPIGNLGDITFRAVETLKTADLILCEDTRVTRKLLEKYDIKTQTTSYHSHSKLSRVEEIIERLKQGKNLALVSDAGTPGISDPGAELVGCVRDELKNEIESGELKIESVPGPSALTTALAIAGVPCANFLFLGFLPHKKGRQTLFKEIAESQRTVVFYESPHRLLKTLESLQSVSIPPLKKGVPEGRGIFMVTVCRELTKIFEQVVFGSAEEVLNYFQSNLDKIRGEFVVIVSDK